MDKKLLKIFFSVGVLLIPFAFRRNKLKDWLLVFFIKGYISSILATILVQKKEFYYPVRFVPKIFKISITFDYLLFPLIGVFFNQTTLNSKPLQIFFQSLLFSIPMTIIEALLERYTKLINYKKGWNSLTSFWTLTTTLLFVRLFMSIIRKFHLED
ncbi:MAG: CBO0543 family protein [Bacillota bacterium]